MIHVHQKTNIASNHVFGGMAWAGALLVRRPQRQLVSLLCPYFNMVEGQSVLQDVAAPPSCPRDPFVLQAQFLISLELLGLKSGGAILEISVKFCSDLS